MEWGCWKPAGARRLRVKLEEPDPRYRATVRQYLDRVWREARDERTGTFDKAGSGMGKYGGMDQAAFTVLFTLLGWPHESLAQLY